MRIVLLITLSIYVCAQPTVLTNGEFLYWTPRVDDSSYASSGAVAPVTGRGKVYRPHFGFDPGFRVGIGWLTPHDMWDVKANYTWFHSKASSYAKGRLTSNWRLFTTLDSITKAKAAMGLQFNVVDLELGRLFMVSDYLELRPFMGVKGTWQKNDYRASFRGPFAYGIHSSQDIWGAGIRAGCTSWWLFTKTFGLYGDVAVSGLWTHMNATRKDQFGQIVLVNVSDKYSSSTAVFEFALGLKWGQHFNNEKLFASISAGFEQQLWLNMYRYIKTLSPGSTQSLSLMGLTVRGRVDF